MTRYIGMVTSDWSECLSPSGPFDMIIHHYPQLRDEVDGIFKGYTGNRITMAKAMAQIKELLPAPLSRDQLDAYLQARFDIYADVAAVMAWCRRHAVLFMINSTGAIGYFQRAFALGLLEAPEVLAAGPIVRFAPEAGDPQMIFSIEEISDKPVHSEAAALHFGIPHKRIVVIGDSGGDGPHFEWGHRVGATLVASLAKSSLVDYCRQRQVEIHHHWNPGPAMNQTRGAAEGAVLDLDGLLGVLGTTCDLA